MAEFQITSAEVLEVLYSDYNPNLIYGIKVKPLDGTPSDDETSLSVITAKPLNTSILRIPIKGEVVLILKAPSAYASGTKLTTDCYYFDIVSLQSSIHHNALPTVSSRKVQIGQTSGDSNKYNEASSGNTNKQEETKIDENFSENPTVKPLQPYVGDLLIEGRYGNSIRFSTTPKSGNFTVAPKWNGGSNSAPITIFRNSKQGIDTQKINDYITEDFTNNENIIVMTSGQNIEFEQGSGATTSINSKSITSWKDENWGTTPQILISSGRLVFNSNQKEIIAFAKNGIGLSTETSIAIDAKNTVAINSNKIELGNEADEPLILGNVCKMWIESLIDKLSALTVITPTGTSSPLTTSPQWPVIASLKAELPNLLSDLSFTKKSVSTSSIGSAKVLPIPDFKMTPKDKQEVQQAINDTNTKAEEENRELTEAAKEYIAYKEEELYDEVMHDVELTVDDYEIEDDEVEEESKKHFSYITDEQANKQVQTAQGGTGVGSATGFENIPIGIPGGGGGFGGGSISDLFQIIAGGEGDYNSVNRGKAGDSPGGAIKYFSKNLTDMTVGELIQLQSNKRIFAAGKYQIIPVTMRAFVKQMKINSTDRFDAATQEKFPEFVVTFARPTVGKYIRGQSNDRAEAANALAREFASVGLAKPEAGRARGESRYSGTAGNKASIPPEKIEAALDRARGIGSVAGNNNFVTMPPGSVTKGAYAATLALADAKVPIVEQPMGSNWGGKVTEYLRAAGAAGPDLWCASAVTYWWKQAGLQTPPGGTSCANWADWAKKTGRWSIKPVMGAAALFSARGKEYGHIGIVVQLPPNANHVITVQGNTSRRGFSSTGGVVAQKQSSLGAIKGFVIPI